MVRQPSEWMSPRISSRGCACVISRCQVDELDAALVLLARTVLGECDEPYAAPALKGNRLCRWMPPPMDPKTGNNALDGLIYFVDHARVAPIEADDQLRVSPT